MRPGAAAWAELLRLPALFTVPGDALAGAACAGSRPTGRTLLAAGASVCLYEAGMALNDWADRAEDAVERPHRPLPSGRVRPASALLAASGLTAAGLALAARAGRPALAVAAPLAATVWAYDLALKRTSAGPAAMATARGLDLLLGAAATTGRTRGALPSAVTLGAHTLAVTHVSRRETQGGSSGAQLAALAVTGALTARLLTPRPTAATRPNTLRKISSIPSIHALPLAARPGNAVPSSAVPRTGAPLSAVPSIATPLSALLTCAPPLAYAATSAGPLIHAALNPSPPLTQRAVGAGIRALIPLQAALAARAGAPFAALLTAALAPAARTFARRVSVT
ncbi:SCO3242 family prenyltransferase [Streptomyces sp. NPDC059785]|uniref:SCO3242 family prenyltransferase n=1 Tax=unclassified Streptomyces TaxID=2593676 RepID=UPI0036551490